MALVSLELFKQHVRADDFSDDDQYLAFLIETASDAVVTATARTEAELLELGDGRIPLQLQQAAMMLAGHWYNQREGVSAAQMNAVPYSVDALVKPFRRLASRGGGSNQP